MSAPGSNRLPDPAGSLAVALQHSHLEYQFRRLLHLRASFNERFTLLSDVFQPVPETILLPVRGGIAISCHGGDWLCCTGGR